MKYLLCYIYIIQVGIFLRACVKISVIIVIFAVTSSLFTGCKTVEKATKMTTTAGLLIGIGYFLSGTSDFVHMLKEIGILKTRIKVEGPKEPEVYIPKDTQKYNRVEEPKEPIEPEVYIPKDAQKYNGHHYYVFDGVADSWHEAQRYCESLGGYLAIISDAKENQAVYDIMRAQGFKHAYFGLTDEEEYNVWRWVDGRKAKYTNWYRREPNHTPPSEHYGMFYDYGSKWNDGCFGYGTPNGGRAFICEWDH